MTAFGTSNAPRDFITDEEAVAWIVPPDGGNQPVTPQLTLIVGYACEWVQNFVGRTFAPQTFTRRFDGAQSWDSTTIELPAYPVLQIVSVKEYRGSAGVQTLPESTPTSQVDGWQCEYLTGRLIRVFQGNIPKPWFPGSRNIEVTWEAGYNPIPRTVKLATLELIKHWWINTQENAAVGPGVGGGQYDTPAPAGLWAGVPNRIEAMLEPYLQVGIG